MVYGMKKRNFIEVMEGLINFCTEKRINLKPGLRPCTDGKETIYLPWLKNDASEEDFMKFFHFAAHEQSHFHGKSEPVKMSRNKTIHSLQNAVDDIRCESEQEQEYPGLAVRRKDFYDIMTPLINPEFTGATKSNIAGFVSALGKLLIMNIRSSQLDLDLEVTPSEELTEAYDRYIKDLEPDVTSVSNFDEACEMGQKIYDRLKDMIKEEMEKRIPPPPPPPTPEESEDDDTDDDRSDSERSETSGEDSDPDDEDEDPSDSDSSEDGSPDKGADDSDESSDESEDSEGSSDSDEFDDSSEEGTDDDGNQREDDRSSGAHDDEESAEDDTEDEVDDGGSDTDEGDRDSDSPESGSDESEDDTRDEEDSSDDRDRDGDEGTSGKSSGEDDPLDDTEDDSGEGSSTNEDSSEDPAGTDPAAGLDSAEEDGDPESSEAGETEDEEPDPLADYEREMAEHAEKIKRAVIAQLEEIEENIDEDTSIIEVLKGEIEKIAGEEPTPYMVHPSVKDHIDYNDEGTDLLARSIRDQGIKMLGSAGSRMTRLFVGLSRPRTCRNKFEGRMDMRAFLSDPLDKRKDVYTVKQGAVLDKAAVSIMMDNSGSMSGVIVKAYAMMSGLGHYLSRALIPTEMVGFTADTAGNPEYRDVPVYLKIVKKFEDPWSGKTLRRCVPPPYMCQNAEVDCLRYMVPRLWARPEKKKILFIIGDGAPFIGNKSLNRKLTVAYKEYIELCRKEGIYVFGFGIDCDLSWIFGEDYVDVSADNMAENLVSKLTQLLSQRKKYRLAA